MCAWMHLKFNRRTRCIYLSLFYVISLWMFGAVCDRKLYTTSTYLYCTLFAFFSMSNSGDNSSLWTWIIPSWVINHSMAIRSANRWYCWQNTCFKGFFKVFFLTPNDPSLNQYNLILTHSVSTIWENNQCVFEEAMAGKWAFHSLFFHSLGSFVSL